MFNDFISTSLFFLAMTLLYLSLYGKSVKIQKLENKVNELEKKIGWLRSDQYGNYVIGRLDYLRCISEHKFKIKTRWFTKRSWSTKGSEIVKPTLIGGLFYSLISK